MGFEPTISAGERPHIQVGDRAVTGTVTNVNVSKREDVTREIPEKLHNEGFRNPNSLKCVISAIKPRISGRVGNFACMRRREVYRI
jgi:hypothetical protein